MSGVTLFVTESNRIEGILRPPTADEIIAHQKFIILPHIEIEDLEAFVQIVAPNKPLRDEIGMNVRVGSHIAPSGGINVVNDLAEILADANTDSDPYEIHRSYETLHPFMDGNGRSGRALWLWMMNQRGQLDSALKLGFLHIWYYQSLSASRAP